MRTETLDDGDRMTEHPVVQPWARFTRLLRPEEVVRAERDPDASLEEHLAGRRALASEVVEAAHAVIDAIDQAPEN